MSERLTSHELSYDERQYYIRMGAQALIDLEDDPTNNEARQARIYALGQLGLLKEQRANQYEQPPLEDLSLVDPDNTRSN